MTASTEKYCIRASVSKGGRLVVYVTGQGHKCIFSYPTDPPLYCTDPPVYCTESPVYTLQMAWQLIKTSTNKDIQNLQVQLEVGI